MGFLQQRYDGAIDRYRESVGDHRSKDHEGGRSGNLKNEILSYHYRCKLMGWATLIGLIAAIFLIGSIVSGAVDVIAPDHPAIAWAGTAATLLGFVLVIAAAIIVILEGRVVHAQLNDELRDIPALKDEVKQRGQGMDH